MRALVRLLVCTTAGVVLIASCRRTVNRWGATDQEVAGELPGDDLVLDPQLRSTRAITIKASVDQVFPWLTQLGQGRGGFYSYDWLENLIGLDMHSTHDLLPEFQHLEPGDQIPLAPGPPFYGFIVADVASPTSLVLQMRIHPFTGRWTGTDEGQAPRTMSLDATWAFVLHPTGRGSTRLVTRNRARTWMPFRLWTPYLLALEAVEFVMERRMLLGIRDRAEAHAATRVIPGEQG